MGHALPTPVLPSWRELVPHDILRAAETRAVSGRRKPVKIVATGPWRDARDVPAEAREQVRHNLAVFQSAGLVGALIGTASDLATGRLERAAIIGIGIIGLALSIWLRRWGRLTVSAVVFLITFVVIIHGLSTAGKGLHDTAAILYPVVIVCAALMLDRTVVVVVAAVCIASMALTVGLGGPGSGDWVDVFNISIMVVITAVAVHLLLRAAILGAAEARASGRRLARVNRELEARNAELERFTYVVSHDLKSPLVTIRGFLDYVARDAHRGDLSRLDEDVERICLATTRMNQLLDDLLELSRTGRIARAYEDVNMGEVVREAHQAVEGRFVSRGVRLEVADAVAGIVVRGDRVALVELVQNLLDNAAKFTGTQEDPRVAVGVRQDPGEVTPVFYVSDNGQGVAAADHERVFDLFHQLDPRAEGTGLGLALARSIAGTHGGRLWVESKGAGHGSTFCFTLPAGADPEE